MLKATQRKAWSHDETVVALGLYFQVTFSCTNMNQPEIVRVSKILGLQRILWKRAIRGGV